MAVRNQLLARMRRGELDRRRYMRYREWARRRETWTAAEWAAYVEEHDREYAAQDLQVDVQYGQEWSTAGRRVPIRCVEDAAQDLQQRAAYASRWLYAA
jgi:hypothetical protein